jgi:H+/Cl- antiporter ClcA
MKQQEKSKLGRRDFLRAIGAGAGVAVAAAAPLASEAVASETDAEKKQARYQANSADVQTFYKVNRYPS